MSRGTKSLVLYVLAVFVAAMVWFFWRAHENRRSSPGRVVRFFKGESPFYQNLNDLAEDIRSEPTLRQLQPWAVDTLRRYREGELKTNGFAQFCSDNPPAIRLDRQERPEFVKHLWGETNEFGDEEPEIFVVLDAGKKPEAIAIGWYSYGIQIGPPEYHLSYASNYFSPYVQAKPGVYVYGNYK